jgi:hypothetical protein
MLAAGQSQGNEMTDDFRKPPEPYRGPERRKVADRRQGHDRRDMIRFEPDKDDRRSGKDRRKRTGWDTIR